MGVPSSGGNPGPVPQVPQGGEIDQPLGTTQGQPDPSGATAADPINLSGEYGPGKYIKFVVPDFTNVGTSTIAGVPGPTPLTSYLRLGAVEDVNLAGVNKTSKSTVGLIDAPGTGTLLTADPNAPVNPQDAQALPTSLIHDPKNPTGPTIANTPSVLGPSAPDPTGEDLASLVQGFADDSRPRGRFSGTPGGQPYDPGTTAVGPMDGYPQVVRPHSTGQVNGAVGHGTPDWLSKDEVDPITGKPKPKSKLGPVDPNDYRTKESSILHTKGGWRDHTDGNRITTTRGDKVEVIRGNYKLIVLGRQDQTGIKPKLAGMDISGGQTDAGPTDLSADSSTDQDPSSTAFSNLFEWRQCWSPADLADMRPDSAWWPIEGGVSADGSYGAPDKLYRSISTTKKGTAPKVQSKYQLAIAGSPADGYPPIAAQTPDGKTFAQPITGGVSINETWSYQTYNYTGVAYYPAKASPAFLKNPDLPGVDHDPTNPSDPWYVQPNVVIFPVGKTVNKSYLWLQSTETFVNKTVAITAGPRTDAQPLTATPPQPLLYERDLLDPDDKLLQFPSPDQLNAWILDIDQELVIGDYPKIAQTWTQTHVENQATIVRAGTTLSDTLVSSQNTKLRAGNTTTNTRVALLQHTKLNAGSIFTETTVGDQHTTLNADSTLTETTARSTSAVTTVGTASTVTAAMGTSAVTVVGMTQAVTIAGVTASLKAALMDMQITMAALSLSVTLGQKVTATVPKDMNMAMLKTLLEGGSVQVKVGGVDTKLALAHVKM